MNYFGWPLREGTGNASLVVRALARDGWSPQGGGGAPVDMLNWSGNKANIGATHTIGHRAPPNLDQQSPLLGFISTDDVPVGAAYTLEHNVHIRPGYLFDRAFLQYLWAIEPPARLAPRYSARHTVDKMLFALQYTPGPSGESGGAFRTYTTNTSASTSDTTASTSDTIASTSNMRASEIRRTRAQRPVVIYAHTREVEFGFIAQAWYNYLGQVEDPNTSPPSHNFTLLIQHSPDWGPGMDAWTAAFMLLYRQKYGDPHGFINRTYTLMRNGFVALPWNLEGTGTKLDGALWQAWDEKHGVHPAAFLGPNQIFWLCDSGKSARAATSFSSFSS
jgi:hypothetical protein